MSRRKSREATMKLLYQIQFNSDDIELQILDMTEEEEILGKEKVYVSEIVNGVLQNVEDIDKIIEENLTGWKMNRVSKVNLAILRLSIYEILYREDIPNTVSINEAVELTKKFSGEDSKVFVNGLLAKVVD